MQEDGSVVKVNATTIYDKEERGNGFSFVHSVRKTKKQGPGDLEFPPGEDLEDLVGLVDLLEKQVVGEEEEDLKNEEEEAEQGEEENEIFSKRK